MKLLENLLSQNLTGNIIEAPEGNYKIIKTSAGFMWVVFR